MSHIIHLLLDKPWLFGVTFIVSIVLGLLFEHFQYEHRILEFLTNVFFVSTIASIILGFIFLPLYLTAPQRPVSNSEWVEIYKNDLDATVELDFQDYKEYYHSSFAGTHDDSLKSLSKTATYQTVVRNIKLTVKKDHEEIQKFVVLDKNNLIQKYDDLNNVKIAKVEYRKIDGLSRVLFGVYESPHKFDEIGEIRITLESSEDQELRKVFGQ